PHKALNYGVFIDNIIALLRIGKSAQNDMTLSDVIKPYLEKRQLQLILLATPEEWKLLQEKDRRFSDLFQVIRIAEPDQETATRIVLEKRKMIEKEHACEFTTQALQQLFVIHRNYRKRMALPGSVIQLMEQLGLKYRFNIIDAPEARAEFETISGLNEKIFDTTQSFEDGEVRKYIAARLIGQEKATDALINAIHTIKAKINNPQRPLASFLFIGPTGVGKTQAAKILGQYLMGNEDQLLRFDMNEYIDASSVHRLIGDYHNPEGQLTGKVRYQPFGIVLLDEIEKAHPAVHDLLLQVLDDGRLTDSLGRTVDFSNTIIVMTSNVGAREVSSRLGFDTNLDDEANIYRKAVENRFRPEFINRIDQIIIFNPLKLDHILTIARLQIKELLQRDGFVRRTTILNISADALKWVAQRGFDARMGGRALKRQIEKDLTSLSAEQLISTYSESPIIFEINFSKEKLIPKIIPLEFSKALPAGWLPQLPSLAEGRRFYSRLIREVEKLERQVNRMEAESQTDRDGMIVIGNESGGQLNWQYYDLKDRIIETKNQLQTISLGFKEKYFKEGPAVPLRLKGSNVTVYTTKEPGSRAWRESIRDRLFQQEALAELSEAYQYGAVEFDSLQTEFLQHYVDVVFLQAYTRSFVREDSTKYLLRFRSLINGLGQEEIKYLRRLYNNIFTVLDINHHSQDDTGPIELEGHAISTIFSGETGIHLFYQSHRNPLPIMVSLEAVAAKRKTKTNYRVVRLYDAKVTLTDLRTGFSNAMNMTAEEFKILLLGGLLANGKIKPIRFD
ncbi:MAG: AAA family ATPase, partial [Bacteroidota bacterium]